MSRTSSEQAAQRPAVDSRAPRIAFFVPSLDGGGVQKIALTLAGAFADAGHPVDLLITRPGGAYTNQVPANVNLIVLRGSGLLESRYLAWRYAAVPARYLLWPVLLPIRSSRVVRYVKPLACYLRDKRPAAVISGMSYPNLVALWARNLAGLPVRTIVVEHNTLSQTVHRVRHKWRWRYLPPLLHAAYPQADRIVAVSDGVARDVARTTGLPRRRIQTVYNPVVTSALAECASQDVDEAWLAPGQPPVIMAIGRLTEAKRFDVLIRAFARVRAHREVRLMILGEGRDRQCLESLVSELGVQDGVRMPGFVENPYACLARCSVFVLSSDYEGLPTVLIEALACGCRAVSTDCPSGPQEILDHGRYGCLVPCGDDRGLADAVDRTLDMPPDRQRQQDRAGLFSLDASVQRYRELCFGSA